jgi:hypothetical protein
MGFQANGVFGIKKDFVNLEIEISESLKRRFS